MKQFVFALKQREPEILRKILSDARDRFQTDLDDIKNKLEIEHQEKGADPEPTDLPEIDSDSSSRIEGYNKLLNHKLKSLQLVLELIRQIDRQK